MDRRKTTIKKNYIGIIPDNINGYIEPFGGGAWVLFYKEKWAELELYNDLDNRLVNLFNIVKYHPCELARQMCYVLASRTQFEQQLKSSPITDIKKSSKIFIYTELVIRSKMQNLRNFKNSEIP